ncbi:cupin domain-containing protein [Mycobacterium vicinigordonae]|uniref:Cupin domain-containing protein n=1 Tax=Mycobacterium vicinigordonae TaxID=1719132 RepID=A0A7D6EAK6_9MYCO|nr:cupin domain-containing protein [Mycobacterium vicinigordonae]
MSASGGRLLVTGVDADGCSCVAQHGPVTLQGFPGFEGILYSVLYGAPAAAISDGGRRADLLDLGVAPGAINWKIIDYGPGVAFSMHHTDTVDLDLVISGSVELLLDDGAHPLEAGDTAVVTGVDHAWRTGPRGCRLSVISLGVSPSQSPSVTLEAKFV